MLPSLPVYREQPHLLGVYVSTSPKDLELENQAIRSEAASGHRDEVQFSIILYDPSMKAVTFVQTPHIILYLRIRAGEVSRKVLRRQL